MRTELQLVDNLIDDPSRQLLGLSDMEIVTVGTRTYLLAAGAADGGMSSFELLSDGTLVSSDDIALTLNSGTEGVSHITTFSIDGTTFVVPSGNFDDNQMVYELDEDGNFIVSDSYTAPATFQNWLVTEAVEVGGNTFLFGSVWADTGLFQFDVLGTGDLTAPVLHPDTGGLYLGDVVAIHTADLHGKTFLFVASGVDAGLHCYEVGTDGSLALRYSLPPSEGGFSGISDVASIDVGGERSFIVVASSGTDSLLVYRVSEGGKLQHVETLTDTAETRFAGVTAVETFEFEGRQFVLAAGSDDGLTLFEIDYRGRLKVLTTVEDTALLSLQNVTDIEVVEIGGQLHIFVSSGTDHGITQFVLDLPGGANLIRGGADADILHGTAADDTIFGHGKADELFGHDGNDRLVDGLGPDVLWGGAGADIFEFVKDKKTDWIMDYEIGIDRIDLSGYALLYNIADLVITSTAKGATILVGDDKIRIESIDGTPITASMFTQDDFIFG